MSEHDNYSKIPVIEGWTHVGLLDDTRSDNRTNGLLIVFDLYSPLVNVEDGTLSITLAIELKTTAFIFGFSANIVSDNYPLVKYALSNTAFIALDSIQRTKKR